MGNARLGVRLNEASKLTFVFNNVDIDANEPGGLTEQEWHDNPTQAPRANQYDTRKTTKQTQAGLHYEHPLTTNDDLSVMVYAGERETTQYQSMPVEPQLNPTHPGGVIELSRHYQGIDSRWTHRGNLLAIPVTFTTGFDYETLSERRKGYENFVVEDGATNAT